MKKYGLIFLTLAIFVFAVLFSPSVSAMFDPLFPPPEKLDEKILQEWYKMKVHAITVKSVNGIVAKNLGEIQIANNSYIIESGIESPPTREGYPTEYPPATEWDIYPYPFHVPTDDPYPYPVNVTPTPDGNPWTPEE